MPFWRNSSKYGAWGPLHQPSAAGEHTAARHRQGYGDHKAQGGAGLSTVQVGKRPLPGPRRMPQILVPSAAHDAPRACSAPRVAAISWDMATWVRRLSPSASAAAISSRCAWLLGGRDRQGPLQLSRCNGHIHPVIVSTSCSSFCFSIFRISACPMAESRITEIWLPSLFLPAQWSGHSPADRRQSGWEAGTARAAR